MFFPEDLIEEIREQNNIVQVVSQYVRLTKKGNSHFGLCPFHNEKTPSFSVSEDKQIFYCFGCHAGGNVITFIMDYENYNFVEAIKYLADRVHIQLPEPEMNEETKKAMQYKQQLYDANKEAAKYYYYQLGSDLGKKALDYLEDRGVDEKTRKRFGLGFSPFFRDDLHRYLKGKQFSDTILMDSGLIVQDKSDSGNYYDRFFNRVMFPIFDTQSRVIGFGGRVMGDGSPKYLNSPETKLFDKGKNLYALNLAKTSRRSFIILVEGYMDVISLHQAGFDNAVASLGTAFTQGQAHLLKRYTDEVIICYDGDGAGINAALKAIGVLEAAGHTVRIVRLTTYKDPDELIKNEGADSFEAALKSAIPSFIFQIEQLEAAHRLDDPESRTKFFQSVARKLVEIENEIKRDSYVEAILRKYKLSAQSLRSEMETIGRDVGIVTQKREERQLAKEPGNRSKDAVDLAQRNILTFITSHKDIFLAVKPYVKPSEFVDVLYQKVAAIVYNLYENNGEVHAASIINQFIELEEQKKVAQIFNNNVQVEHQNQFEKMINESVQILKNAYIDQKSQQISDVNDLQELIRLKREMQNLTISLKQN